MADRLEGAPLEIFREGRNYAHVSIARPDGTVQSVIVWAHADEDGTIALNSAEGRAWPRNLRRAGNATITLMRDNDPYDYVAVEARLVEDTHEGADEHIDSLAQKYLGEDRYPWRQPGERRILFRLEPQKVVASKG